MKKVTQKQLAFYLLYREYRSRLGDETIEGDASSFIPTWRFVGEIDIKELNMWGMMSYKCPTRLTDIYQENPNLLEREMVKGKSGAKYYQYRIRKGVTPDDIKDPALLAFRRSLQQ